MQRSYASLGTAKPDPGVERAAMIRILTPALVSVLLLAAVPAALAQESGPADEAVRRCIELMRRDEMAEARGCFAPGVLAANGDEMLKRAHAALQIGDPPEIQLVNWRFVKSDAGRTDSLVYHVRGAAQARLLLAQTREVEGAPRLVVFGWEPAPLDLSERFPFTLDGVPPPYYALLLLAVATPILMIYAAILCFTRKPRRRWLWLVFVLLGFGKLSVVWLPGPFDPARIRILPLSVQVLGSGIQKVPIYDPWVLSVSFPLGAVLFLWRQRGGRKPNEEAARELTAQKPPVPMGS